MVILKAGTSIIQLQVPMLVAMRVAESVYDKYGTTLVVTSGDDSTHGKGSLHPKGLALDFRTKTLPPTLRGQVRDEIARALPGFDVVLEVDHLHVEYDPNGTSKITP